MYAYLYICIYVYINIYIYMLENDLKLWFGGLANPRCIGTKPVLEINLSHGSRARNTFATEKGADPDGNGSRPSLPRRKVPTQTEMGADREEVRGQACGPRSAGMLSNMEEQFVRSSSLNCAMARHSSRRSVGE